MRYRQFLKQIGRSLSTLTTTSQRQTYTSQNFAFQTTMLKDTSKSISIIYCFSKGSADVDWNALKSQFPRQFHNSAVLWGADYYEILGIPRNAEEKEIKRAYHKKAMELHPDRNKNDPKAQEKFQEIHKAYTTLSNKQKRRVYDQLGSENYERMDHGGDASSGYGDMGDVHKVWEQFSKAFGGGGFGFSFGGIHGHHDFFRGGFSRMMMQEIRLSFMEAVKGTSKKLNVDPGMAPIDVQFPAGIDNGQQIVVETEDNSQLILTVSVDPHPIFQRRALDIFVNAKIDMVDAALGGTTRVPTLDGDTQISFGEGTQHGDKLRLKGKGVRVGQQRGDMYVVIGILVPTRLTNRQRQFLIDFNKERQLTKAA